MASRSNCPPYINKSRVCENWKFGSWKPRGGGGQTLLSCRSPSSGVKEEGEQEPSNKKRKKKIKKHGKRIKRERRRRKSENFFFSSLSVSVSLLDDLFSRVPLFLFFFFLP